MPLFQRRRRIRCPTKTHRQRSQTPGVERVKTSDTAISHTIKQTAAPLWHQHHHTLRQTRAARRPLPHRRVDMSAIAAAAEPPSPAGIPAPPLPVQLWNVKKCPHNRRKTRCRDCGGSSFCVHQRRKDHCAECTGCAHGKRKERCSTCGGQERCSHDRLKWVCKDCRR